MCCSIKIEKPYQISDVINELVRPWENPSSNCSGFQVGTQIHKQVKQRFHESNKTNKKKADYFAGLSNSMCGTVSKGQHSKMCLKQQRSHIL